MFELHPRLQQDCIALGRFSLCRLLLMNDSHYPWFILVPERAGVTEIFQLPAAEQQQLLQESSLLAQTLATVFTADKMNIAAIGNLVPQLHVHHVVRYKTDAAWPAPVWGFTGPTPYDKQALAILQIRVASALGDALCRLP
ncbi:MAG: HIT domain-containing protein [Methylococcaceae bacterium]|nr:MAG: HIT domain-containing protein [Methylococcaceae bacterium]